MKKLCFLVVIIPLLLTSRSHAEDSSSRKEDTVAQIKFIAEQYRNLIEAQENIVCEYTSTELPAMSLSDALKKKWDSRKSKYSYKNEYIFKDGKVLALNTPQYSLEIIDEGSRTGDGIGLAKGAVSKYLRDENIRLQYNPTFNFGTIGSKGNFKNQGWGLTDTPYSLGVMGGINYGFGSEKSSLYKTIFDSLSRKECTLLKNVKEDIDGDGKVDTVDIITTGVIGGDSFCYRYTFSKSSQFNSSLLRRVEYYVPNQKKPLGSGYILEYMNSPYDLPFPKTCFRILHPYDQDESLKEVLLIEVTSLQKSDDIPDEKFKISMKKGTVVTTEDSGFSIKMPGALDVDFEMIKQLEQQVMIKQLWLQAR